MESYFGFSIFYFLKYNIVFLNHFLFRFSIVMIFVFLHCDLHFRTTVGLACCSLSTQMSNLYLPKHVTRCEVPICVLVLKVLSLQKIEKQTKHINGARFLVWVIIARTTFHLNESGVNKNVIGITCQTMMDVLIK